MGMHGSCIKPLNEEWQIPGTPRYSMYVVV
jgi:hypothetical protein